MRRSRCAPRSKTVVLRSIGIVGEHRRRHVARRNCCSVWGGGGGTKEFVKIIGFRGGHVGWGTLVEIDQRQLVSSRGSGQFLWNRIGGRNIITLLERFVTTQYRVDLIVDLEERI